MKTTGKKFVMLVRVSTSDQKERKLGLISQRSNISSYVTAKGGTLIKEFEEVQSGGNKDRIKYGADISLDSLLRKRPTMLEAVEYARDNNAILVVKEVSRLTRFSLLFEYLTATGVQFLCTDYPTDNHFMLGLRVKFFEQELEEISRRTIAGLSKSTKVKGAKWKENLAMVDEKKRIKALKQRAVNNVNNKRALFVIIDKINIGFTLQQVADMLNNNGYKTSTGKTFYPSTVKMLFDRVA